jgi:ethanolamine transporter
MGLCSLAPVAAEILGKALIPAGRALGMDPSVFPALIFPVDMGGWNLCTELAADRKTGVFFGAVASSVFGACTGYCVPVASRVIEKHLHEDLAMGTLAGLSAIPVALLSAGLEFRALIWNLLPFAMLAAVLCYGLLRHFQLTVKIFTGFGQTLSAAGILGIALQCLRTLNIWTPLPSMLPFGEATAIVVRIAITMTGAMIMVELINRFGRRLIERIGGKLGVEGAAVSGMLAAAASALIVYTAFAGYLKRGRVLLAAVCASASFVFGGQLSVVSAWAPEMLRAFLIAKLLSGFLAVAFTMALLAKRKASTSTEIDEKYD